MSEDVDQREISMPAPSVSLHCRQVVRLDAKTDRRLRRFSKKRGIKISTLIRELLTQVLDHYEEKK